MDLFWQSCLWSLEEVAELESSSSLVGGREDGLDRTQDKLPEQKGSRNPINRAVQLAACTHLQPLRLNCNLSSIKTLL
jgi:hypothetical protein